jgi:RNA polymerase sigma factor (TIGR02999 family)
MSDEDLTELLRRAQAGDAEAAKRLFAAMYGELRTLARARLRAGGRSPLLDTTSLVHESYVRFAKAGRLRVEDRVHFLRWAARVMRSVIVDFARRRGAGRRGGGAEHVTLTTGVGARLGLGEQEILGVHEALQAVERLDPRMAKVVEMRYFAGMTEREIAEALDVGERTVRRDWEKARLFLRDALGGGRARVP